MTRIALLLCAVLLCLPGVARADDEGGRQGPCKADYEKFCKDVKPGEGRIIECMKQHKDDLSKECQARIAKAKEKRKEAKADFDDACGGDVKTLCGDVKAGHGAILKCLRQNKDKVSDSCKTFVKEKRDERRERRAARRAARKGGSDNQGGSSGGDQGGGSDQ